MVKNLLIQHQEMRNIINSISETSDEDQLKKILAGFGALLDSHIRSEERQMFPKLEEAEQQGRITLPHLK